MYERFYNLRERPFSLSPDPDYLYPSRVHTEALNYLRYGIEGHAGFVVITGEIGSGKTTLLQTVLRGLDRRTSVARLVNTQLDARELIEAVMLDFGLSPQAGASKPALIRDLARYLVEQRSAGRLALLIVDEAQNLTPAALEEIRMLSNLETEKSKLIQIVLVGQPNLHDVLSRPELEQLRQRVTVRYHLRPLDPGETAAYINHRLKKAALGAPMEFPPDVTDLIGRASQGLPRKINVIADAALLFGYGEDKRVIDVPLVQEVLTELEETGVIPRTSATAPPAAVMPVVAPATPAAVPAAAPSADVSAALAAQAQAIAQAERDLAMREARIAARERELAEQHRILTEQYRLMKSREATAATPTGATWPPRQPAGGEPPQGSAGGATRTAGRPTAATPIQPARTLLRADRYPERNVWTRVWRGLFGVAKPVLED